MAELALIPWDSVEAAPEWAEAPTYKRDEYLAQWEETNLTRANEVGADPAIVERIKSHAASIRNELYPSEVQQSEAARTVATKAFEAGAASGQVAAAVPGANIGDVAAVAGIEAERVRDERRKIIADLNAQFEASGRSHRARLTEDNGDGIMRIQAPVIEGTESDDQPRYDMPPEVDAMVEKAANRLKGHNMALMRMGNFRAPSGITEEYRDLPFGGVVSTQMLGGLALQSAGIMGMARDLFGMGAKPSDIEANLAQLGSAMKQAAAAPEGAGSSIARGAGTVGSLVGPGGIATAALRAASEAYETTLVATGDQGEARMAAVKTAPAMALFMGAGRFAGNMASKLAGPDASALARGLYGFGGATVANIGTSSVLRALEAPDGQAWEAAKPTLETLTVDTLFAVMHGYGDYNNVKGAARERAEAELRRRGFTKDQFVDWYFQNMKRAGVPKGKETAPETEVVRIETPAEQVVPIEKAAETTPAAPPAVPVAEAAPPQPAPDPVAMAAIRLPDGTVFTGPTHALASDSFEESGTKPNYSQEQIFQMQSGYVTKGGEFLTDEQALQRAKEVNAFKPPKGMTRLESNEFLRQQGKEVPYSSPVSAGRMEAQTEKSKQEAAKKEEPAAVTPAEPTGKLLGTAVRLPDGTPMLGNATDQSHTEIIGPALDEADPDGSNGWMPANEDLGFAIENADGSVTFVDRKVGAKLAKEQGLIPQDAPDTLTSEILKEHAAARKAAEPPPEPEPEPMAEELPVIQPTQPETELARATRAVEERNAKSVNADKAPELPTERKQGKSAAREFKKGYTKERFNQLMADPEFAQLYADRKLGMAEERAKALEQKPPTEAPKTPTLLPQADANGDVSLAPPAEVNPETPAPLPTVEPTEQQKVIQPKPSETKPAVKADRTGELTDDNHRLALLLDGERERIWRLAEYRNAPDPEDAAQQAIIDVLNSISEADAKDPAKVKAALTTRIGQVVEDQRRRAEAAKRGGKQEDERLDDPESNVGSELEAKVENKRHEVAEEIAKAAADLPAPDRQMLFGIYDGKTLTEIAKELGISPQAANKRWEKVQTKMAERLQKYRQQEGALLLPGGRIGTARIPVAAGTRGTAPVFPYQTSKVRRKVLRIWLGKHGALPPEMREQLRKAGLSEGELKDRYSLVANDLRAAINHQTSKRETDPGRVALLDRVSDFLEGRAGVLRGDSVRVQETALLLRKAVDAGTELLVREGAVHGLLANIMVGNIGGWMRQYYAAFDPDANWNLDALRQRASKTGPDAAEARKILDDAEHYIYVQETMAGRGNNPEHIEPIMRAMTDRTQVEAEMFGTGGGTGSANISSYLRRENIAPVLQRLMGKETNPLLRAEKSGAFLSQAVARHRSQQALRQMGLQSGAFWLQRRGRYSVQVPAPDPGRSPFRGLWTTPEFAAAMTEAQLYKPDMQTATGTLNRLWSWFVGMTKSNLVVLNPRSTMANALGGGIQSIASGMFIPMGGAGLFESGKLAWDAVFRGDGVIDPTAADAAIRGRIRHIHSVAMRAGMIDSSVTVGDFERSVGEALNLSELDAGEKLADRAKGAATGLLTGYAGGLAATGTRTGGAIAGAAGAVGGALAGSERITNFMRKAGRIIIGKPDAFWKVRDLVENYAQGLERGMTMDEAMNWAADRTRATFPSYDAIPEALRTVVSKIPGANIFFQFSWELVRNNVNNIRAAVSDLRDSNPVAKKHGARRLMGAAMLAGILYGIYDEMRRRNNWTSSKDKSARRSFLPEWDKKGMVLPIKQEGTKLSYVNGRYMAPQLIFAEAARAGMESKDPAEAAMNVTGAILDDFVRSNASLDPLNEALHNRKDSTGKPITIDTGISGALDRFDHFVKRTMAPGFASEAGKIRMAINEEAAGYGRKYSLEERFQGMAGLRVQTYDFKDQLSFRLSDLDRKWNEISKLENGEKKKITDMKKANPDAYAARLKEIQAKADRQRGELQLAAVTLYGDAIEVGIPDKDINAAMMNKSTKLPKDLRLTYIAKKLRKEGKDPSQMTLAELRALRGAVGGRVVEEFRQVAPERSPVPAAFDTGEPK